MAREILGVAGGIIGAIIGGPIGAQIGYTIGSGIGGQLDPYKVAGPRLGEAPVQTSRDGIPIPIGWGIVHCHGNIIQAGASYDVTTTESSGSLWTKTETSTTRRYKTFAIGVIRGPISGIRRIWEDERLVYDTRDAPAISAAEQAAYAAKITIYTGTETQLPDADLEAITGVGSQPAYRGLAYIVWPDYDITDFGSRIPTYRFEVLCSADLTVTSKVYPIEDILGVEATVSVDRGNLQNIVYEGIETALTPGSGTLDVLIQSTSDQPIGVITTLEPLGGGIAGSLVDYTDNPIGVAVTVSPTSGTLSELLVSYSDPAAGIATTITPQSGALS